MAGHLVVLGTVLAGAMMPVGTAWSGSTEVRPSAPIGVEQHRPQRAHATVDGLIDALYEAVSFEPGEDPDWDLVRSFFLPEAVVVFAPRGSAPAQIMDLEAFITDFQTFYSDRDLVSNGFRETLAGRRVTEYGNIAHAFVVFEPRVGPNWDGPTTPGVDSVDLVRRNGRWWVASITTQFSSDDLPIPDWLGSEP